MVQNNDKEKNKNKKEEKKQSDEGEGEGGMVITGVKTSIILMMVIIGQ